MSLYLSIIRPKLKSFALILFVVTITSSCFCAENPADSSAPNVKAAPRQPITTAHIILEEENILDDCGTDKICVEGLLKNDGKETATQVRLRVEVGGSGPYLKPRTSYEEALSSAPMNPGDRQEFFIEISRKIPYQVNHKEKIVEVGKYNFQIVPVWKEESSSSKPRRKKTRPI